MKRKRTRSSTNSSSTSNKSSTPDWQLCHCRRCKETTQHCQCELCGVFGCRKCHKSTIYWESNNASWHHVCRLCVTKRGEGPCRKCSGYDVSREFEKVDKSTMTESYNSKGQKIL